MTEKEEQRQKIEQDIAAFLAKGGRIKQCTPEDNAAYREPPRLQRDAHLNRQRQQFQIRKA